MNTFSLTEERARELRKEHGSPLYLYDAAIIRERCGELKRAFPTMRLYYACKANTNPDVIRIVASEGLDIETTSPGEIAVAREAGLVPARIAFSCANITEEELVSVVKQGVLVHLDSLTQVEYVGRNFPQTDISVRLNLNVAAGHHIHTMTGGDESKFGIHISQKNELHSIVEKYGLTITGLHQHIGSGFSTVEEAMGGVNALLEVARSFPDLTHVDFGGGFGVPYRPDDARLPLDELGESMREALKKFSEQYGRFLEMSFEPGRYVVAEAGALLATVTDVKHTPGKTFVGIDSGMGHLIRPVMYDAYHEIQNLSHPKNPPQIVTVGGYYCESGDVLAVDRSIPMPEIGDLLLIQNAGAYGYVMSSDYNLRPRPKEIVIGSS